MPHAILIVVAIVVVAAFGWLSVALAGALLMVLVGCLRFEDFMDSIRWDIILLLAGVIPLGIALEKTGAAALLATGLVGVGEWVHPLAFFILVFAATSVITEVVSNNASVVLLLPVVVSATLSLGVDPRPFALVVILAASTSMMTPIGYQTNTMVYGPGNYRFSDFFRAGAPLNALLCIVIPLTVNLLYPVY